MLDSLTLNNIQETSFVVTGGAGFIGANLVQELIQLKAKKVIVFDDLSTGYLSNIEEFKVYENFEFIQASITDFEQCKKVFSKVDVIFHMAALGSVPRSIDNPLATNEINVKGFVNVLYAAKEAGVNRVVYSSSSSVYGDNTDSPKVESKIGNPLSPYAVSKRTNELYAQVFADLYGMNIIGLRYFNVFGPKQSLKGPYSAVIPIFISNLLKGENCFINGTGEISRDFTFVSNVVHANIMAAYAKLGKEDPHLFNIAMEQQVSLNDLYQKIETEIETGLPVEYRNKRLGDIDSSKASIEAATRHLTYQPNVTFDEGLVRTIEWYKSQKN
jgi:UDP-N-acetylglucosamine 4-epimerase